MYMGNLVFSQVMEHLPLHTFRRCVQRYRGNHKIQSFSCLDQFRCMAFAQLTYRESLRDIEACLRAQQNKLYHMGIRGGISRNTLSNANKVRDWRIYADFAQSLIQIARKLYVDEDIGAELDNTVYALDATTIDLCLSVFPWAHFRSTKAAVKLHTLLDLRGSIPTFIHISDGKMHDVNVLDLLLPEAGAFYVMDRGYVDFSRLFTLHQGSAFFVIRAKSNLQCRRLYSMFRGQRPGAQMRSDGSVERILCSPGLSRKAPPYQIPRSENRQDIGIPDQQFYATGNDDRRSVSLPLAGRTIFQMDQTAPANQVIFWHDRQRSKNSNLDRRLRLRSDCHHQKTTQPGHQFVYNITDFKRDHFRKYNPESTAYG